MTICVKFIPSLFKSLLCDICALLVNATSVNAGIINYCNDIKNAKIHFVIEKSNKKEKNYVNWREHGGTIGKEKRRRPR